VGSSVGHPSKFLYSWKWEDRQEYLDLPFPESEYDRRLQAVRDAMEREGLDCVLVMGDARERGNVRWISNFYPILGQTAVVLPRAGAPVLTTSAAAHGEPLHSFVYESCIKDVRATLFHDVPPGTESLADLVADALDETGASRVGVCNHWMIGQQFADRLRDRLPSAQLSDATALYETCKAVKSPLEIQIIREAQAAADRGIMAALEAANQPGVTELDVCVELEAGMRRGGIETVAYLFDSRVCSGPRSALKNGNPTRRKIEPGDMVFIDISATYRGYAVDSATSTVVGGEPTAEQRSLLECAALMSEAVVREAKAGVSARSLVETSRAVARECGEERWFIDYIAGHGIGTSQLEKPRVNPHSEDILEAGNIFSVEPMVVDPARGTGTIEGMCLVTEAGGDYLSAVPRRPWERTG
jgi:Xaa-Pro aminopeptidase/Xaa-Pro dipeptidase